LLLKNGFIISEEDTGRKK